MNELESLLQLNMVQDVGTIKLKALLDYFGTAHKILSASRNELMKVAGIGAAIAEGIVKVSKADFEEELKLIRKYNIKIVTLFDNAYPENLKQIYDPPIVLYIKGDLLPEDKNAIAIVGSRRASFYGLSTAEDLAYKLSSRGITIVSGMARGIDTASHKGALKAGGRTMAVLGSGLANIYPSENRKLSEEIAKNGVLISEFPIKTSPHRQNFPQRNRIISGLSLGVVIVEAAKRSGALITADMALEQGREVFAVPGKISSVTSLGTHSLIRQGAKLAATVDDIIEELKIELKPNLIRQDKDDSIKSSKLEEVEQVMFKLLTDEPKHIDELSQVSSVPVNKVSGILVRLQIKGFIKELPGKMFVKRGH